DPTRRRLSHVRHPFLVGPLPPVYGVARARACRAIDSGGRGAQTGVHPLERSMRREARRCERTRGDVGAFLRENPTKGGSSMRLRHWALAACVAAACFAATAARAEDSWVGKRVMTKKGGISVGHSVNGVEVEDGIINDA